MSSLHGIFISSFAIAFSGAVAPGPVLSVTIAESLKRGLWAGPGIILGHGILEIVLIGLLMAGLGTILSSMVFIMTMGLIGGLFLLLMAVRMLRTVRGAGFENTEDWSVTAAAGQTSFRGSPVVLGIVTSLANPYWLIWWATIGLSYLVVSSAFGLRGLLFFFTGHILADLFWYSGVSFIVSRGARRFTVRAYRCIMGACALLLLFFGVYFIIWSIARIF